MPTWGRSFRGAFAVVAFGVLWEIVGILVAFIGLGMVGLSLFMPFGSPPIPWVPQVSGVLGLVLGVILVVVGIALALLGFLASFLKVLTEMTAEEVLKRNALAAASRAAFQASPQAYLPVGPPPSPSY